MVCTVTRITHFVLRAERKAPAGDAAEEVQAVRLEAADRHLDPLRQRRGERTFRAAFEHEHIRRRPIGRHDVEGNALDRDVPGLREDRACRPCSRRRRKGRARCSR